MFSLVVIRSSVYTAYLTGQKYVCKWVRNYLSSERTQRRIDASVGIKQEENVEEKEREDTGGKTHETHSVRETNWEVTRGNVKCMVCLQQVNNTGCIGRGRVISER